MMWLAPQAVLALALIAGPVIAHLLARRNARRVIFPATHFLRARQSAAVKVRRLSDAGLLLVRVALVTVAVLAAAQPIVMTPWRLARWNARLSRAIVVDTSRSTAAADVSRLTEQETSEVFEARRIDTPALPDGIERALRWLRTVPPSRREIVVISDFQQGAITDETLRGIPSGVGVRLIRAGGQPDTRRETFSPVEGWREGIWQATAAVDATSTRVSWTRRGAAEPAPRWISVLASPAETAAADRALRAAVSPGVPEGDNARRVVVRFPGAEAATRHALTVRSPWIASAEIALRRSDPLRDIAPVLVTENDGVMVVDAPVAAGSLEAPAVVRAAILAVRPAAFADGEAEPVTLPDADLARWRRDPQPVSRPVIPVGNDSDRSDEASAESDARWLWAAALVLLAVEFRVRRTREHATQREVHADAA